MKVVRLVVSSKTQTKVSATMRLFFVSFLLYVLVSNCADLGYVKHLPGRGIVIALVIAVGALGYGISLLVKGMAQCQWSQHKVMILLVLALLLLPAVHSHVAEQFEDVPVVQPSSHVPIVLIGFDAASWELLHPLIKMGQVPCFAHFQRNGTYGNLETLAGGKSLLIWTSIVTGKTPRQHGLIDWVGYRLPGIAENVYAGVPHSGFDRFIRFLEKIGLVVSKIPDSRDRRVPALWNVATHFSRRTAVIGWWASWPAEKINGHLVTNHLFPLEEKILQRGSESHRNLSCNAFPEHLAIEYSSLYENTKEDIITMLPGYLGFSMNTLHRVSPEIPLQSDWFMSHDESTVRLTTDLLGRHSYDLFLLYFRGLDIVEHFFWKYLHPGFFKGISRHQMMRFSHIVPRYYRYYDDILERITDASGPESNIFIVSDHGMDIELKKNPFHKSGQHTTAPPGIIIANGPQITEKYRIRGMTIYDIMPTLLNLQGLPAARDLSGITRQDLLTSPISEQEQVISSYDRLTGKPTYCQGVPVESINQKWKENLRKLGYIE